MQKTYYVYILSNARNTLTYIGVTNNLVRRVYEHREGQAGYTGRYKINRLVYFELFGDVRNAIEREKQLKGGSRLTKLNLVNETNAEWRDLYSDLI